MKVAFIIDSSASISNELKNHPDVYNMELSVTWGGKSYADTTDIDLMKEFYKHITESDTLPKTSQPEPGKFVAAFKDIIAKGYDAVYCITISSAVSGTYNTLRMVSEEFTEQIKVFMIDSKGTSFLMEKMLEIGLALVEAGNHLEQIQEKLEWFAEESRIYVLLEQLENLVKGGRLSSVRAFLGNQLRIKPILYFDDVGKVVVFEKVRTTKRVYKRWMELIDDAIEQYPNGIDIAFAHGDNEAEALKVRDMIEERHPGLNYRIGYLTPVLGTYGGKDALGIGILPKVLP